jgi:lipid-A-disaccharide synthase-like uncharacterized protein
LNDYLIYVKQTDDFKYAGFLTMSFETAVIILGIIGQTVFFSRFIVQWLQTEKNKKSTVPVSFWYLSISGSFMLLGYSIIVKDPIFIAGQSAGFIIYLRNLYFIAIEKGVRKGTFTCYSFLIVLCFFITSITLAYFAPPFRETKEVGSLLFLYILGLCGQFFFFMRFFVQWLYTEKLRKSTFPIAFWYLSIVGSVLLLIYSIQVQDVVFIVGQCVGLLIYMRNIYFINKERCLGAS